MNNIPFNFSGKPADRATTKPTYLVVATNPLMPKSLDFYRTNDVNESGNFYEIRGWRLTKDQALKLSEKPHSQETTGEEVNVKIPFHSIVIVTNVTYKVKSEGESK